jgi:hypothetical protein
MASPRRPQPAPFLRPRHLTPRPGGDRSGRLLCRFQKRAEIFEFRDQSVLDGDHAGRGGRRPSGHPSQAALVHADCGRGHLPSEDRQEQVPSSLLYFKSEPSGEGWPTRAGERPAPWTLPQNLIDEARALADGRIPLPEPERVPWDVLIAQAVNWDIPERLAA